MNTGRPAGQSHLGLGLGPGGITLLLKAPHTTGYIVVSIGWSWHCFVLQRCIYIHRYSLEPHLAVF